MCASVFASVRCFAVHVIVLIIAICQLLSLLNIINNDDNSVVVLELKKKRWAESS